MRSIEHELEYLIYSNSTVTGKSAGDLAKLILERFEVSRRSGLEQFEFREIGDGATQVIASGLEQKEAELEKGIYEPHGFIR
jgi:hypothetical protein